MRHEQNREYSDCPKTSAPACCHIRCCGNRFGRTNARNRRNPKVRTRRYHRHATKNNWYKEYQLEQTQEMQETEIYFKVLAETGDIVEAYYSIA